MNVEQHYSLSRRDCDLLRILASVSVVIVHCIHFWVEGYYSHRQFGSIGFFATCLDQLTRFTVPAFFFLSGFGLASQYRYQPLQLSEFYRRRIFKIALPFVAWSLVTGFRHFDFLVGLPWQEKTWHTLRYFLKFFFCDGFDYQYYFLIVIFQFYLVFPILFRMASKLWVVGIFFLMHLALTSPVETYLELWGLRLPGFHPNLWLFYAFFGVVGIHAALRPDFLARILQRWSTRKVVAFWGLAYLLVLSEYFGNLWMGKSLYDIDHFNRWSVAIYCLSGILLFLKLKERFIAPIHRHHQWAFLYSGVAPYTFFVYLVHTHILRAVDYMCWEVSLWDFSSRMVYVIGGSYGIAWAAQWLLEDFPKLRYMFGLPDARISKRDLPGFAWLSSKIASGQWRGNSVSSPAETD